MANLPQGTNGKTRDKTPEPKVREAEAWLGIESEKARERQAEAARQTNAALGRSAETVSANLREASNGKASTFVAEKVGMKPRSYEKAKAVVDKADALKAAAVVNLSPTLPVGTIGSQMSTIVDKNLSSPVTSEIALPCRCRQLATNVVKRHFVRLSAG